MNDLSHENRCDVLIVGAGIAGLMAARAFHDEGISHLVVEKAERVGGRIVTEHLAGGWADTGAQFFTVREPIFQTYVGQWLKEKLVFEWAAGWPQGDSPEPPEDGHPRYAGYEGLNAVCRRLAQDISIHKAVHIRSVSQTADSRWTAVGDSGQNYTSSALILTPPAPILLSLLDKGEVPLSAADRNALAAITYAPCICGVFHIEGETTIPEPGAIQSPTKHIQWIADNQQKGISPAARTITLHFRPEFSQLWWLSPEAELKGALRRECRPFLAANATIKEIHIHRWPYALPTKLHPARTLLAKGLPPLAFAGDAFNGPRVEGAALSGLAAAQAIRDLIC